MNTRPMGELLGTAGLNGSVTPDERETAEDYALVWARFAKSDETHRFVGKVFDRWSGGLGGTHFRHPVIELPGQVGNDAQLPLDQHELRAMMHLMLLNT